MRCPFILSSKASSWLIKGHSTGSHSAWQPWLQLDNQSDRAMLLQDIESCYILRARSHQAQQRISQLPVPAQGNALQASVPEHSHIAPSQAQCS